MARILLVDDEPGLRQYLRILLEEAGYEVVEARDGIEALPLAQGLGIDLVLTDLVMPNEEGIGLIRSLRSSLSQVKIAAMSGARNGKYLTLARKFGADAVLSKPFPPEKLLTTVGELINGRTEQRTFR